MKVKIQQTVKIDEEDFEKVLVEYLQKVIEQAEEAKEPYGPAPHLIEAMKFTHDWFAYPDKWYHTVDELEGSPKPKPAKMKAKKTK